MVGAILAAGAAVAGGIASVVKANKAKREKEYRDARARTIANAEMNRDYLQSAEAQSTLNLLRQQNERLQKRQDTSTVRGGLTDEARVGMSAAQNESIANVVSNLSAQGESYRRSARRDAMNLESQQAADKYADDMNTASAIGNAINGLGQAAGGVADAYSKGFTTNFAKNQNNVGQWANQPSIQTGIGVGSSYISSLRSKYPMYSFGSLVGRR